MPPGTGAIASVTLGAPGCAGAVWASAFVAIVEANATTTKPPDHETRRDETRPPKLRMNRPFSRRLSARTALLTTQDDPSAQGRAGTSRLRCCDWAFRHGPLLLRLTKNLDEKARAAQDALV